MHKKHKKEKKKNRTQLGVHKVPYQPLMATGNSVYERSVVALCAHCPTLYSREYRFDPCKMGAN